MARLNAGSDLLCDETSVGYGRLLLVIEGEIQCMDETLGRRDELQTQETQAFSIHAMSESHLILFEVPMRR
jgi:hypothetical protein